MSDKRIKRHLQSIQRISNADKRAPEPEEPGTDYQAIRLAELRSAVRGVINTVVGQNMATQLGVSFGALVEMRDNLNREDRTMFKPINSYLNWQARL